jgi:hypothetical protein
VFSNSLVVLVCFLIFFSDFGFGAVYFWYLFDFFELSLVLFRFYIYIDYICPSNKKTDLGKEENEKQ